MSIDAEKTPPGAGDFSIRTLNLRQRAAEVLHSWILDGRLVPDKVYTIREMSEGMGVSVTPVREAVLELEQRGFLTMMRNRGFVVRTVSDDELDQVVLARILLEVPTLGWLAGRIPVERHEHFRQLLQESKALVDAAADDEYLLVTRRFHHDLIAECAMPFLTEQIMKLRDAARIFGISDRENLASSSEEHFELFDALVDGDEPRVREVALRHLVHQRGEWAGRASSKAFEERAKSLLNID